MDILSRGKFRPNALQFYLYVLAKTSTALLEYSHVSRGKDKDLMISLSMFPGNLPQEPARANCSVVSLQCPRDSVTIAAAAC